jgi:hypothetical protein
LDGKPNFLKIIFSSNTIVRIKTFSTLELSLGFAPLPSLLARVEPLVLVYWIRKEDIVVRGMPVLSEMADGL